MARELETGQLSAGWSQSVTRGRWLASRLGFTVTAAGVAVGILTLAMTWWSHPLDGALSQPGQPARAADAGVVRDARTRPGAYAVFALVLGTFIGAVLSRSLPAMAVTLALYAAVQVAVPLWVRPHLVPETSSFAVISGSTLDGISTDNSGTITLSTRATPGDWVLTNQTVNAKGQPVALPTWFDECLPSAPSPGRSRAHAGGAESRVTLNNCLTRLDTMGYRQHVVYQPKSHFWPLQWAETGLYLAASAALTALAFWWTRRKLS